MGKTTGFKEYSRAVEPYRPAMERVLTFKRFTLIMTMKSYPFRVPDVWIAGFHSVNPVKDVQFIILYQNGMISFIRINGRSFTS